ncbi:hypothetical protein [Glutamicibacter nicotianae]|uniref:hypothetical protein n=1 Tax=Glutamicibacter nicotianae TaxID=37929 RepID=UPI0025565DAE|nr:hypothetical protein [Glutamicibacter nicotianae]WIV44528.1 hypothetical protein QQS42_02600 [Glutamicibacter nicotianae]
MSGTTAPSGDATAGAGTPTATAGEGVKPEAPSAPAASAALAATAAAVAPAAPSKPADDAGGAGKLATLPDWAQAEIRASRTAKEKAAENDAAAQDQAARIAALEADLTARKESEQNAIKSKLLATRGLDEKKFLPLLTGDNAEAWEGIADSLSELRGKKGSFPDPAQAAASNQKSTKTENEQLAEQFFGF